MLSRIVKSAKSFINPVPKETNSVNTRAITPNNIMVTTRRREIIDLTEDDVLPVGETIIVENPTSASKRKSARISQDAQNLTSSTTDSPSTKKRKILPVRSKDDEPMIHNTRLVVEIPVMRRMPEPELQEIQAQPSGAKKHKKFGSQEPEEEPFSTALEIPETEAEDNEESSDDDAPEEVGAEDAAREAKSQAQSAAEAVKALKQQRKERSSKPNLTPKKAVIPAKEAPQKLPEVEKFATAIRPASISLPDEENEAMQLVMDNSIAEDEDTGDEEDVAVVPIQTSMNPRKIKFDYALHKTPKDRRVGSTTYRVEKKYSKNLAPKASHNARATKESWLQGRAGKGTTTNRRPVKQGFFKK